MIFGFCFCVCVEVRDGERAGEGGGGGGREDEEEDGGGGAEERAPRGVDAAGARAGGEARRAAHRWAGFQVEDLLRHGQSPPRAGCFLPLLLLHTPSKIHEPEFFFCFISNFIREYSFVRSLVLYAIGWDNLIIA